MRNQFDFFYAWTGKNTYNKFIAALEKVPWIEPIVLRGAMVLRDLRHWFRYRRVTQVSPVRAWLMLPLILVASLSARTAEAIGMYCWLLAPKSTARQARF